MVIKEPIYNQMRAESVDRNLPGDELPDIGLLEL